MSERSDGGRLALAVLALLAWGGACHAADGGSALGGEFGIQAGILAPDKNLAGESGAVDFTAGLRGGSVFTRRLIWYVDALYSTVDSNSSLGDARLYWGRTGLEWLFVKKPTSSWYLTGGFGWVRVDYSDGTVEDFHRPLVSGGFGQRYSIGGRKQLRWELRADVTVDNRPGLDGETMSQGLALIGLIWGPPGHAGVGGDSDGDGVKDLKDHCPATPMLANVDEHGCPHDGDGDGVPDGVDRCTASPLRQPVNEVGCPRDSDGDGVFDGTDACPETPERVLVDEWGCPKDRDRDGVPEGLDLCPRTFPGVVVDEQGCDVDSDSDGIPDGIDRCPDSSPDSRVDGRGCPATSFRYDPDTRTLILWLEFEVDSVELDEDSQAILDEVLPVILASDYRFEIGGHIDPADGESDLQRLSHRRAQMVRDYLVKKGVASERLEAKGYGATQPMTGDRPISGPFHARIEIRRID